MNLTSFPRELLYKNRDDIEEFNVYRKDSVNFFIYYGIKEAAEIELLNFTEKDYLDIFNDAYYLCVLFCLEKDATRFLGYIDVGCRKNDRSPDEYVYYKRIVNSIIRVYLSSAFARIPTLRYLSKKDYVPGLYSITKRGLKISFDEFKPRIITSDVLSKISWTELTDNFKLKNIHFCVHNLGVTKDEKLLIIESIYNAELFSDSLYKISYEVDRYLSDKYREFGGGELSLSIQKEISKPVNQEKIYNYYVSKLCDYSNTSKNDKVFESFFQLLNNSIVSADKHKLDFQNIDLVNENKSLRLSLSELQEKYHQLEVSYKSQITDKSNNDNKQEELERLKHKEAEMNAMVEAANAKVEEMDSLIQELKTKLGNEMVPLTVIVEGIKRKAKWAGLPAASSLFDQIDILLYEVETWRNNRIELMTFFEELATPAQQVKVEVQPGAIAQITDKEIINNKQPEKLIE